MSHKKISKEEQRRLLQQIMDNDQELGLYDMDYDNSEKKRKNKHKPSDDWYPDQKL